MWSGAALLVNGARLKMDQVRRRRPVGLLRPAGRKAVNQGCGCAPRQRQTIVELSRASQ
jgi:hypothetical protein